ncbi:MAG: CDP-glycerol glycerophosphotransferase family protein [Candidatus Aenigmarchaeota archaeon]|nr:CDP-glycerol glycerophosphotransferase family protein [Candidatus Aenigmarchaeota archaeon]
MESIEEKTIHWLDKLQETKLFKLQETKLFKLQETKLLRGKNLKELLAYKDISLWWFIRPHLAYTIFNIIKRVESGKKVEKIKTSEKFRLFFGKRYIKFKELIRKNLSKIFVRENGKGCPKILVLSTTRYWTEVLSKNGKTKRDDIILGAIIEKLKKNGYEVVCIDTDYTRTLNLKILWEKLKEGWIPFECYYSKFIEKKAERGIKNIKKLWEELKSSDDFKNSLTYKGIPLWGFLKERFDLIFSNVYIYNDVKNIETAIHILEKERPAAVLMTFETGYYALALIAAAKKKGIPTIAIQHGIIHSTHGAYTHKEVSLASNSLEYPIPDKTAVYGKYTKNILIKRGNYPKGSVVVTGQPRYDILVEAYKIFNRDKFCERYNLNPRKKIVLIVTQTLRSKEERDTFLRSTIDMIKKIPDIQIVIKPKPNEDGKWQRRILLEEKVKGKVLPGRSNIFEVLYACDAMITVYSTTVIEAMILNKPVIIVNLTGEKDPMPYVESGASLGVYKKGDIVEAVRKALYDKRIKTELRKNMKKFVYEHAYKADGKATERVVDLIKQTIMASR